jgi:hypothetical protein
MKRRMAVAVLLVFAATSASEAQSRSRGGPSGGGRSGGGRSSGGHVSRGSSGGHSSVARSSGVRSVRSYAGARTSRSSRSYSAARSTRSTSVGARYSSGHSRGTSYGRGYAVPRGSAAYVRGSSAQSRHPRVGYGTGYSYGHGSRYGYRNHGYGNYGYRSYGYGYGYSNRYYGYPAYYGGYAYAPYYGWGLGVGLGFYYGGYPSLGMYAAAPYHAGYATDAGYGDGGSYPAEPYSDRGDSYREGAELQLLVLPDDASVWIDNEFRGTARDVGRLTLAPGRHQLEIVRPGFRSTTREIELRPGASNSLRIELERP